MSSDTPFHPSTFEFATSQRILFGRGVSSQLGELASSFGGRALVVTGRSPERWTSIIGGLYRGDLRAHLLLVESEPSVPLVCQALREASEFKPDLVVGIGGGSVIDAAKAVAGLYTNGTDPYEYLEVIGRGKPLRNRSLPFVAVPTTAGAGAEVTRNAVLESPEHGVKVSLRSPFLLPAAAVVDPELTLSLPKQVTAFSGLDALVQVIEPFISRRANPLTDALCAEGIRRAARSLRKVVDEPNNLDSREDLCITSLFGGLALANAGLGAVHGFAGPLGGMTGAPHGAICASLLPEVLRANAAAAQREPAGSAAASRLDQVGRWLTGNAKAQAQDAVQWACNLCEEFEVPRLKALGLKESEFDEVVGKAQNASSMRGNPFTLSPRVLREILERSY